MRSRSDGRCRRSSPARRRAPLDRREPSAQLGGDGVPVQRQFQPLRHRTPPRVDDGLRDREWIANSGVSEGIGAASWVFRRGHRISLSEPPTARPPSEWAILGSNQ